MPMSVSRRDRPAKPALSREWIVAETIRIAQAEGLGRATMRRVAQALDTGPASLYVYVANTAELHAAVLDELLAPVQVQLPGQGDWQVRLHRLLADYTAVLFAHPGLARSALTIRSTGPNTLRLYDRVLGLLLEGGVEPGRASWGVDLLLQYATANAAEHSEPEPDAVDAPGDRAADWHALTDAVRGADPQKLPHLTAHADPVLSGSPAQRIRWAVDALLAGISATATPPPTNRQQPPERT